MAINIPQKLQRYKEIKESLAKIKEKNGEMAARAEYARRNCTGTEENMRKMQQMYHYAEEGMVLANKAGGKLIKEKHRILDELRKEGYDCSQLQ